MERPCQQIWLFHLQVTHNLCQVSPPKATGSGSIDILFFLLIKIQHSQEQSTHRGTPQCSLFKQHGLPTCYVDKSSYPVPKTWRKTSILAKPTTALLDPTKTHWQMQIIFCLQLTIFLMTWQLKNIEGKTGGMNQSRHTNLRIIKLC